MNGEDFMGWLLAMGVILGVFLAMYMAWRQQGIADTVEEIRDIFRDKAEDVKDTLVYK